MPVTGQLWYSTEGNPADAKVAYVNSDGTTSVIVVDNTPTIDLGGTSFTESLVLDPAAGLYFVLVSGNEGINAKLLMGQIGSSAPPTVVFTFDPTYVPGPNNENNLALSLHIDPINTQLYVGFIEFNPDFEDATQGIRQFSYDPTPSGNPVPVTGGALIYTQTVASIDPSAGGATPLFIPRDLEADYSRNFMYAAQYTLGDGFETNALVRIDLSNLGAAAVSLVNPALFPLDGDSSDFTTLNGIIVDVEVDADSDRVYFTTHAEDVDEGGAGGDPEDAIWLVTNASLAANATPTKLVLNNGSFSSLFTTTNFYPGNMVLDEVNNVLYVESENSNLLGGGTTDVILKFQLAANGLSATLIDVINVGFTGTGNVEGLFFNQLAEIAPLTANSAQAIEQVTNLDLLTVAPTITDFDGDHLNNATVRISNSFVGSGDNLYVLDGGQRTSGLVSGTNITVNRTTDGSGNQTLTLSGYDTLANYQAVLNAVTFLANGDNPTNYGSNTGRTVTWQVNDGAAGNPSGTVNGADTNVRTSTITVAAVNDAPVNDTVLSQPASGNEDSQIAIVGLSVSDVDADPANDQIVVTLQVDNGTLTLNTGIGGGLTAGSISGNGSGSVTITATQNQINATFANAAGLLYQGNLNFNGNDTLTISTNDGGNTGTSGALIDTDNITITVIAQNDTPTLTDLGDTVAATEQTAVLLDGNALIADVDLDPLNGGNGDYSGASLTIVRNGGANAQDSFAFDTTGAPFTANLGSLQMAGLTFATFTNAGGTLTITFVDAGTSATSALVDAVLQRITYTNTSDDPPASVVLNYTFDDGSPIAGGQGGGAAPATATGTTTVNITGENDEPTLIATGGNPIFTEGGAAADLFGAITASTVEAGQTFTALTLTVTNVTNGPAEILTINGVDVALTHGNAVNVGIGSVTISFSAGTATVAVTGATLSAAVLQTLLDGLSYRNTSEDPTDANRVVTITQLVDSGSNAAPNDNTASLAVASTVNVNPINDEPTLAASALNPTFAEDSASVDLFDGVAASTVDAAQTFTSMTVTVTNVSDGANEILTFDGSDIALTHGTAVPSTASHGLNVTVSVVGGTATVTFSGASLSASEIGQVIDLMRYRNTSQSPIDADRVVTITQLVDSGSNSAPNDNIAAPGVASTVDVNPVNDAPTILGTVGAQAINDNATVNPFAGTIIGDVDAATTLTVTVTLDAAKGVFSTLSGFTDMTGGVYRFTGTADAATTAIRGLVFDPANNRVAPDLTETTTFTISVIDGSVVTPVTDSTTTVVSTSINDAPTIIGTAAGQAVNDNATINPFSATIIGDVDPGSTVTVTVTLDNPDNGVFTTASLGLAPWVASPPGTYTLTDVTPTEATARLQALVFEPADNLGPPGSTEETTFTVSVSDGSVVSPATDSTTTVISTSINDSPVLDNTPTLVPNTVDEDAGAPFGPVGTLISDLVDLQGVGGAGGGAIDNVTDPDPDAITGIAVTSAVGSGAWYYSINDGANWLPLPIVSNSAALLLNPDARLYFRPNANFSGTADIIFRAWDQTAWTNGQSVDTTGAGTAPSPFSAETETAEFTVNAINDAPVIRFGSIDLAFAAAQTITVLTDNGAGGFVSTPHVLGGGPHTVVAIATADVNNDGRLDIVTANAASDTVAVLLGNGAGGFTQSFLDLEGDGPTAVTVADLNGDDRPDIVTANGASNNVSILFGSANGTFAQAIVVSVAGTSPQGVAVGDIDGDGDADIVTANGDSNNISILLGDGSGAFAPAPNVAVGTNPVSVALGDLNGDGILDIVTANRISNDVSILLGDGAGGFLGALIPVAGGRPFDVALGDLNGDGVLDIVTANRQTDNVSVLLGRGDGGFEAPTTITVGLVPLSVVLADRNGDGRLDIVTSDSLSDTGTILINDGAGGFSRVAVAAGVRPASVALGNFDSVQVLTEDHALPLVFTAANRNAIVLSDVDANGGDETLTLSVANGTLTLATVAGLTVVSGDGTDTVTLTGSIAELNAAIDGLQYQADANFFGDDALDISLNDNGNSGAAARTTTSQVQIAVSGRNDTPTFTPGANQVVGEDSGPHSVSGWAGSVSAGPGESGQAVTFTVIFNTNPGLFAVGPTIAADGTLSYTLAPNVSGTATISYDLSDDGGIANGDDRSNAEIFTITVGALNDAPVFTGVDATPAITEGDAPIVLDGNATVADVELDLANTYNGATLTLQRQTGANTGDVFGGSGTLSFVGANVLIGASVVGTAVNAAGTLAITFNANATSAVVDAVLQQITYQNTSDAPPASLQISYTLNDGNGGAQGGGGAGQGTGSITVNVAGINDAPTGTDNTITTLEDTARALTVADFGFADVDGNALARVQITSIAGAGALRLNNAAVSAGAFVTVADINLGRLVFTPATEATGTAYAAIGFRVEDNGGTAGGGFNLDPVANTLTIDVTPVNDTPVVALVNVVTSLAENTATGTAIKIADIVVTDDGLGSNALGLIGADAALFQIVGTELRLRAGTTLDFETKTSYQVAVTVDDAGIGASPDATSSTLTLGVTNVNEVPGVALINRVALLAENTSTSVARKVADIVVTDDALGTEVLSLTGADAGLFQIVGTQLQLKAGAVLDFETNARLDVTVAVNDAAVGATPDDTEALAITITNVNEAPKLALANRVALLAENTSTAVARKVADIVITDDALGAEVLSLTGADASLFQIVGTQLMLKAGAKLDFETNARLDVTVAINDATVGGTPDDTEALAIAISNVNEAPTVALVNRVAVLAENTSTAVARKVADIVITDDALGTEVLSLTGADAGLFQIVGTQLMLRAGAKLDFATNPRLDVTVNLDDRALPGIEALAALAIAITDSPSPIRTGTSGNDTLTGTAASEVFELLGGNDRVSAGAGNDRIAGGAGFDIMAGGPGADTFVFRAVTESGHSPIDTSRGTFVPPSSQSLPDLIADFTPGSDKVDLSAIDASGPLAGNQAFVFKGTAAFTRSAGELTYKLSNPAGTANDKTIISGDVNGDGRADFTIELTGLKVLSANDFVL